MTGPIDPTGTTVEEGVAEPGTVAGSRAVVDVGATTDVEPAGGEEGTTGVAEQAASPTALTRNPIGPRRRTPLWSCHEGSGERRCPESGGNRPLRCLALDRLRREVLKCSVGTLRCRGTKATGGRVSSRGL